MDCKFQFLDLSFQVENYFPMEIDKSIENLHIIFILFEVFTFIFSINVIFGVEMAQLLSLQRSRIVAFHSHTKKLDIESLTL